MSTLAPLTIYQQLAYEQILLPPVAIADTTWSVNFNVWNDVTDLIVGSGVVLADRSVRLRLNQDQTRLAIGGYEYNLIMRSANKEQSSAFHGFASVVPSAPSQPPQDDPGSSTPAWLTDVVSGAIANHNANLAAHPGLATGGGGSVQTRTVFTPSNGQTVFILAAVPALPHLSQLFLNGVKARFTLDYTINGAIINWQNRVQLGVSDEFEVFYQ